MLLEVRASFKLRAEFSFQVAEAEIRPIETLSLRQPHWNAEQLSPFSGETPLNLMLQLSEARQT